MAPRYRVRLKDQAGILVAEFDHFRQLEYRHEVDGPGYYSLTIGAQDDRRWLFELDGQIEIMRSDAANGIAWYAEYEGLHRKTSRVLTEAGAFTFTSFGPGYLDLLARRLVAYYSETAGSDKSGPAETVMKAYVDENAGPAATVLNGRVIAGVTPGLSVQADAAGGNLWTGAQAWANLLEALRAIAATGGMRYDVVGIGAALFEFRTYLGQRGTDRRTLGLNPATGLNAAGNPPLVFTVEGGSIKAAQYTEDRTSELTYAVILGRGTSDARAVAVQVDVVAAADSPWNQVEVMRNASNEREANGLDQVGDQYLAEGRAKRDLVASPQQIEGALYGLHYTWGDLVTTRFDGIEADKEITAATVRVDQGGETIDFEFADPVS